MDNDDHCAIVNDHHYKRIVGLVEDARTQGARVIEVVPHAATPGLPFGGVGNSGTGYYHGRYGFDTFSHLRAVAVSPTWFSLMSIATPPFSPRVVRGMKWMAEKQRRVALCRVK